ncbi:CAAX protease self-immunity [Dysgonomonas macrotermitis]|uniref:CAAX protease self-immunity n=2 Tax=Dysgonomonas macrotermitis TaxID=1346286 RepID=A0A1M5GA23_9BACT|nr:CAAX protease self-immunity [Dysgonomonas macrotermitis]
METTLTVKAKTKTTLIYTDREKVFLYFYLLMMLNFGIFYVMDYFFKILYPYQLPPESFYEEVLRTVIIAPIKETFMFLTIPHLIINRIVEINIFLVLIFVATIFSLAHHTQYDICQFFYFFIAGSIMWYYYTKTYNNSSISYAIIVSILLHSMFNLTLTILGLFE